MGAPVSIMWPAPDEALIRRLHDCGAAQVLAKPITPAALVSALAAWFEPDADGPPRPAAVGVTAC